MVHTGYAKLNRGMESMDWNDIRIFLEVTRQGSTAKAAAKMGVSQGTVSRRITALEQALDLELFDRTPRGLFLKPEAEWLVQPAEVMSQTAGDIVARSGETRNKLSGVVRVATVEEIASMLIVPGLPEFRKQWPGISIELLTGPRTLDLMKREADVSLRLARPTSGDLAARKVGGFGFGVYAGDGYLARMTDRQVEHLEELDWMVLDDHKFMTPERQWFGEHFGDIKPILVCTSPKTLVAAVQADMGVAVLPRPSAYMYPGLNRLPIDTSGAFCEIWLVVRSDMRDLPIIKAVMDFLEVVVNKPLR